MQNLFSIMRKAPKRTSAVLMMIATATILPAALLAWGPDRQTYTVDKPADHVTFNSITNNPVYGDERNFVNIKDAASTTDGGWKDSIKIEPGKKYQVRVYVHNNAAAQLNLKAENTRVSASVPTTTAKSVSISGFVSADNAKPNQVWDDAHFTSDQDFNLAYVSGSARIYNNGYAKGGGGQPLPDSIVTSAGAKIGYNGADGIVPGCFQYDNYVYFEVQPQVAEKPDFTASKEVSKHGENKWSESYTATPGEVVDYLIEYRNTGEVKQDNVTVRDKLPAGMTYVNGSTKFGTAQHPGGAQASDNITTTGINIGSYAKNAGTWVMFSAKAPKTEALECGKNTLKNVASIETDYGTKDDSANVIVDKYCQPDKIKVCDLDTKKIISIDEKDFDASKHSTDLSDCKEVPVTPETPSAPSELPTTGPTETIFSILGLGSLIAGIGYYVNSRRAMIGR